MLQEGFLLGLDGGLGRCHFQVSLVDVGGQVLDIFDEGVALDRGKRYVLDDLLDGELSLGQLPVDILAEAVGLMHLNHSTITIETVVLTSSRTFSLTDTPILVFIRSF